MTYFPASPEVTVIVAVYNVEPWIPRCLDALQAQTFDNFEVIMVDDGSTDHSGKICDEYVAKDSRFHVIHKENGGVSSARQCGLEHARGKYVIHADPDDWTEPTLLEHLLRKAEETDADMVICDIWSETPSGTSYSTQKPTSLLSREVFKALFQQLHGSCCNKLVKRACYSKYKINFIENLTFCEDKLFNARLLQEEITVAYLPEALIHYTYGFKTSLSNLPGEAIYQRQKKFVEQLRKYIKPEYQALCMVQEEGLLAALSLRYQGDELGHFTASFPYLRGNLHNFPLILRLYFFLSFHGMASLVSKWMQFYQNRLKK